MVGILSQSGYLNLSGLPWDEIFIRYFVPDRISSGRHFFGSKIILVQRGPNVGHIEVIRRYIGIDLRILIDLRTNFSSYWPVLTDWYQQGYLEFNEIFIQI